MIIKSNGPNKWPKGGDLIQFNSPTKSLEGGTIIKFNRKIGAPVERSIIKLIMTIVIPDEYMIINLNGKTKNPINGRYIDIISSIGVLGCLRVSKASLRNLL